MYILELCQGEVSHEIGLFHTIEDGRELISQLDGYKYEVIEEFEYEYFDPTTVPDYVELKYNGHIVPNGINLRILISIKLMLFLVS